MAVRRSGPCTDAGHVRAASPKRHARATVASRPNGVRLGGISKTRHATVNRVARATSRDPVITVAARSTAAVPTRVRAPSASLATKGKSPVAVCPAVDPKGASAKRPPPPTSAELRVVARKSPPAHVKSVAVPKGASAKRPPPPTSTERRVVARKSPPAHAKSVAVPKGASAKRPRPPTSAERRVVARKSPPANAKSAAVQKGTLALGMGGAAVRKPPSKGTTRRRKRSSIGSNFGSQAELERAKQTREVDELLAIIPPSVAMALLGGKLAVEQLPDLEERAALIREAVALKAGPDGATLGNAVRAWVAYVAYAEAQKVPNQGLPGTAAFVASFLRSEAKRAAAGRGSQGGTSVPNSRRVGLLWLQEKLGFQLQVDNIVVLAAANPAQIRAHRRADPANRRKRQAGSMPITCYLQFEHLAKSPVPSPMRYFARSMCSFALAMSVRAVDALRTVEDADEDDPASVMSGWSYFSKDGEPMRTFAPAAGFLGDYTWWPEHALEVRAARPFPKWEQPYGTGGRVTEASGAPLPYVMPKAHMVASIKACLQKAPLRLSEAEFKSLQLTAHSEHGSPSDMLATIGPHSHFGAFFREDVREIGHWLRLGKLEEQLEGGTAGAQARRRGAPAGRQATGAFGNNAAECAARYCEGEGREGRRSAQLRVRKRWVASVRMALAQWAKPWTELPRGRADYRILEASPPDE